MALSLDVSSFIKENVIDSCSIINILSSRLMFARSKEASCSFVCTRFVEYECLRPRMLKNDKDALMMERISEAFASQAIQVHPLSVQDLQDVEILQKRANLGKGELSSIALAKKIGLAFLTDDQDARALGTAALSKKRVQTIPHLFGWLHFEGFLGDADNEEVYREHVSFGRPLSKYLKQTYEEALRCRLIARSGQ